MNDFRDGPASSGLATRGRDLREAGQHTIAVLRAFGKPDSRVEDQALARDPGGDGGGDAGR